MKYVSAQFVDHDNRGVRATGDDGKDYFVRMDSDVPPWPEYKAEGGVVAPFEEPVIDIDLNDTTALNQALTAEGSVVRALGLVMFAEINKLRVKGGDPAYTLGQFKTALKAQMR